jgi:Spy/CpxP family protein refolding chaperone
MTDIYTRNRLINRFILILVILNLALLATIWYPRLIPAKKEAVEPTKQDKQNRVKSSERLVRFLERELNFTREQGDKFLQLREEHFQKTDQLRRQIDDLRKKMMDHLLETEPGTAEVEKLAVEMGQKMSEHEKVVFYHFIELMEICDAEQKQKYRTLLREILHRLAPPKRPPPQKAHQPPPPGDRREEPHLREPPKQRHRPGPMKVENHLRRLRHQLGLTGSQMEKIRSIVESAMEKLEKIPSDPRYKSHEERREAKNRVHQWEDSQIEALLTDQQKIRYREMKKRRERGRELAGEWNRLP